MNDIISTPCSRSTLAIDTAMTAVGWIGFFYLVINGVLSLADSKTYSAEVPFIANSVPTLQTLLFYLAVAAVNALIIVAWASYHKQLDRTRRRRTAQELDDETLASHFSLSCNQLQEVQDSRVTIIHHAEDGEITHLQTDQLRSSATTKLPLTSVRAA